ncbi:MAG: DPP IV N-terminal domain-containing protein [Chitinophagales bacterium]|nr:DPP IV N-terminal domain-containing protein [Chitinophagales bacterium]
MTTLRRCYLILIHICFLYNVHYGQRPSIPNEVDYKRAESFDWDSLYNQVYHMAISPIWFEDNLGVAYHTLGREGHTYYKISFKDYKKRPAFDTNKLIAALKKTTGQTIAAKDLKLANMEWKNSLLFTFEYDSKWYEINLKNYKLKTINRSESDYNKYISVSPNGTHEVWIQNYNLMLRNKATHEEIALSQDGNASYIYGSNYGWDQLMKGENTPPRPNLDIKWSPDGSRFLTQIMDARHAKKMYMLDYSIDSLYRPELLSYYRGSPGDTAIVYYIYHIYDVKTGKATKINLPPEPHFMDDLAGYGLKWTADSRYLYATYNHRGYQQKDVIQIDAENGSVKTLFSDHSDTNIDYLTRFMYIDGANQALITSEKSGWKQLYLIDFETATAQAITQGEFVVKDIKAIDTKNKIVYFTAAGKESGFNPYFDLIYRVNFDGKDMQLLTPEKLNHEAIFSPDKTHFIDMMSAVDFPTFSILRRVKDGKQVCVLEKADVRNLQEKGWNYPEVFTAIGQDNATLIYGAMWKPTHFDPEKRYPIIDYSYTGPHMNVFPSNFRKGLYGLYNSAQALAELGFIVVQIDGMGSAGRSKAFHNVSYKNMGNNLLDHTLAIKQLPDKYPWIDGDRVGIFGHSAGGYDAAHALLAFNDTYKVAISESADHDWRMEKAWWPEMYVGWPVDDYYHDHSNVTMADKLKGKLLLIHGGIDENVNPSATFKFSEALIKAGKDFDMFIVPSMRHPVPKAYYPYIRNKRWKFFVQHLLGE